MGWSYQHIVGHRHIKIMPDDVFTGDELGKQKVGFCAYNLQSIDVNDYDYVQINNNVYLPHVFLIAQCVN